MRIHFNGLAYFGKQLVDDLNAFTNEHQFVFYDTYASRVDKLKFAYSINKADKFVSFNGVSSKSGALDMVVSRKKPLIMYWHGTDVMKVLEAQNNGGMVKDYIDAATHYTDARWLKDELAQAGIAAEYLPFKYVTDKYDHIHYDELHVLAYLGDGREDLYGYDLILEAARNLPQRRFTIVGSTGKGLERSENISFMGWVSPEEMHELRTTHAIFLRCTKHDGNALSVLEGLAAGQEVIWTYPGEHCHHFTNDLTNKIKEVRALIEDRENTPNLGNRKWVYENHGKEAILKNFIDTITSEKK